MLHLLTPSDYGRIRPLFAPLAHYLTIESVLAGNSWGRVWASSLDDLAEPQTAVLWTNHRVYAALPPGRDLAPFFRQQFIPAAQQAGIRGITLHLPSDFVGDVTIFFPQARLIQRPRLYFRLDTNQQTLPRPALPAGLTLRPVDAALLADPAIINPNYVTDEMVSERDSVDDFLARSFGYCLLHDDRVIGWCMSEYNSGNRCELGIETAVAYQRRGLATLMAATVIHHALMCGINDIGWYCWADNHASIATARKLGFTQIAHDLQVYDVSLANYQAP